MSGTSSLKLVSRLRVVTSAQPARPPTSVAASAESGSRACMKLVISGGSSVASKPSCTPSRMALTFTPTLTSGCSGGTSSGQRRAEIHTEAMKGSITWG